MSVVKSERTESAMEFLDNAHKLYIYTIQQCVNFPKRYTFYVSTEIAKTAGEILVSLKTGIVPLTRDFCYLKIKYRMTDTGYLVKRVWRKSVVRMRRKLKKLRQKYDAGRLDYSDILASYRSWLSHLRGLNAYRTVRSAEHLLSVLFTIPNNKNYNQQRKEVEQ